MDTLYLLTNLIDSIFIKGLFISVLAIIIVGRVLKADTRNALAIIKWIILAYAASNIVYCLISLLSPAGRGSFLEQAAGSYSFSFYLMLLPNTLLPFLLLFKKPGHNKYVLLLISFLMNIGWMIEFFLLYNTDFYRGYTNQQPSLNFLWFIALKGIFIGAVIYAIGRTVTRKTPDSSMS